MKKLFVAIDLPQEIKEGLARICEGFPGAQWIDRQLLHVTIRYIGAVDRTREDDIMRQFDRLQAEPFDLTIAGIGFFPPRHSPNRLWAGCELTDGLRLVRSRVEAALYLAGIERDIRKFQPHVTLARLRNPSPAKVGDYIARHNLLRLPPFQVSDISLYSSWPTDSAPDYQLEESFPFQLPVRSLQPSDE